MSKPRIVIVGHVCIDYNTSEHASYAGWGSSALYMEQVFRWTYGAAPQVITTYGADIVPYLPRGTLLLPDAPDQANTLIYENDTSAGKRTQTCRNTETAGPPHLERVMRAAIAEADVLVVATLLPNYTGAYLKELLSYARADCLKVLCPQGYFRHVDKDGRVTPQSFSEGDQIFPLFNLALFSEEDTPHALGLAKKWAADSTVKIVVTQSAAGATIVTRRKEVQIPTIPIPPEEIIDSVGCGDTFAAATVYGYYTLQDLELAVCDAHRAAGNKLLAAVPTQ